MKIHRELLSGSIILLITLNLFNLLNFIFQFFMARMLTIAEYGVLATLFSMIYIFGVFSESIETILTKYTSIEDNKGKIKNILRKSLKKAIKISLILFLIYLIGSIFASKLLKIEYLLLVINGLFIFISFLIPITRGIMQGKHRFTELGSNYVLEGAVKLIFALALVYFGFHVYGAIGAAVIGAILAIIFSFISLRDIISSKEEASKTQNIYNYSAPVFIITLAITLFYSLDIIIAKIVFSPEAAGHYALASVLSKTIFIGTQAISKAMFPFISNEKSKNSRHTYLNAIIFLSILVLISLVIFYAFPDILIRIFAGRYIAESSSILFYLALAASIVSFANLQVMYQLSSGKTKGYKLFILLIIIEVLLLFFFSQTLFSFAIAFIISTILFLIGSIYILKK